MAAIDRRSDAQLLAATGSEPEAFGVFYRRHVHAPVDQREAVLARIVDERSYEELARTLQTSQSVIRQRVSRGLAALRQRAEERA